ncbi:MAG: ABC transporter permease, partial [Rhodospirillales bacterium]
MSPRRAASTLAPLLVGAAAIVGWEALVRVNAIPPYILPAPSLVAATLDGDRAVLFPSLLITLQITFMALSAAVAGGVLLAVLFAQSSWIERSFYPYAVILQVTPI